MRKPTISPQSSDVERRVYRARANFRKRLCALAALVPVAVALIALPDQGQAPKPLSKNDVIRLLKGDVSPIDLAELAKERKIDFQMTAEVEKDLRGAGVAARSLSAQT
jgi:hypothetical protein